MEPLILILTAGEGKRLYPETKDTPKSFLDIGDKKLIDLVMEPLPEGIEKAVLLRKDGKFGPLERHLRSKYYFGNEHILYQDRITSSLYLPRHLTSDALLILAYYLRFLPPFFSRNSRFLRQFDPVVLVPCDIIVEGLDYLDLVRFHFDNKADITMPVKQSAYETGSNTRIYTVEDGRFVRATDYINSLDRELAVNERDYTHEGAYVLGRKFFDLPWWKFFRKVYRAPDFSGAFRSLKFVPYEGNFVWIDIGNTQNLRISRERYGKR